MMIVLLRFEKFISKKYQIDFKCNPDFKLAYNIINQLFKLKEDQAENIDC
jgi:RNAse (barnase) inhibitor barstar